MIPPHNPLIRNLHPKPRRIRRTTYPSFGIGIPGIGHTSSRGHAGSDPIQNSAIGDSGIAIPKC